MTPGRNAISVAQPAPFQAPPPVDVNRPIDGSYLSIQNCLDDAFVSATRTANARIAQFGVASPQVRDWARAQDAAFANCTGDPLVLPEAAPPGADALTRADRAYQTAAAYFYATRYDEAAGRFRAIAADASSPWRPYGRYLAARALIRSGTVPEKRAPEPIAAAAEDLQGVLADPSASSLHTSARGLLDFVEARIHPADRLRVVSTGLVESATVTPQQLTDYEWLMRRLHAVSMEPGDDGVKTREAIAASSEMNDWMQAMREPGTTGLDRAVEQWKSGRRVPWLVAAMWTVPADLAREAVKWAKARSSDQRAAEALAHAVEGTRWSCPDKTTPAASRAAFQTLHRLFPRSDWALRTKYWY